MQYLTKSTTKLLKKVNIFLSILILLLLILEEYYVFTTRLDFILSLFSLKHALIWIFILLLMGTNLLVFLIYQDGYFSLKLSLGLVFVYLMTIGFLIVLFLQTKHIQIAKLIDFRKSLLGNLCSFLLFTVLEIIPIFCALKRGCKKSPKEK